MLPALLRLPEVSRLIDQQSYFVIHAPRQTGKTTALLSLAQKLNAAGSHVAVVLSAELAAGHPRDVGAAELAMLGSWRRAAIAQLPIELLPPDFPMSAPGSRISAALTTWAVATTRPLVVLLDEMDSLRDTILISVLSQIRDGHRNRPHHFPASLALIGVREVRSPGIPFNVTARSLLLRDFTIDEVTALYAQHTTETGQRFESDAVEYAFHLTQGQPWLINALAKIAVEELAPSGQPICLAIMSDAKQLLVERKSHHLDRLAESLRDPRIRSILEPMNAGLLLGGTSEDDRRFAIELGIIRRNREGSLEISNPIYREIISRLLAG